EMERWKRSNHMFMMNIKQAILKTFRGPMLSKITTVKEFITDIKNKFFKNKKAKIG
ncbi:hypothetical protein J1N35_038734, partial [Gossypium stocksii]